MASTVPARVAVLGTFFVVLLCRPSAAETPTPLANWQLSAGEVLSTLPGPVPKWRVTLGVGAEVQPTFSGSKRDQFQPAFTVDIRYRDIAFLSDGEGLGVNLLHGKGYRAGVALGYDLGRSQGDDHHLRGLRDVSPAPEAIAFAQYFLKPVVLTADVRQGLGGNDGLLGSFGAYVPLPLRADQKAVLFMGPSVSVADARYMQAYYGVDAAHARTSGYRAYDPGGGLRSAGIGASLVYFLSDHWLLNGAVSYERLLDGAADSPITETKNQFTANLLLDYMF